jgi:hypothetical protein
VQPRIYFGSVFQFAVTHVLIVVCTISEDTAFPRVQQSMVAIGMVLLHDIHCSVKHVFQDSFSRSYRLPRSRNIQSPALA